MKKITLALQVLAVCLLTACGTDKPADKSLSKEIEALCSNPEKTWICTHRANTYDGKRVSNIPENSLPALAKAIEEGANLIEIDVRTTADDVLVVHHDTNLDRTTNGSGPIAEKTLTELKSLRLKAEDGTLTDQTIPTLEEMLLAGKGKAFFNLDRLDRVRDIAAVAKLVDSLDMTDQVMFYVGGNKANAEIIRSVSPSSIIFPWVSTPEDVDYWVDNYDSGILQMGYTSPAAESVVAAARAKGRVCYTNSLGVADENMRSNDYTEIDKIRGMGINVIQTDYIELLRDYIRRE